MPSAPVVCTNAQVVTIEQSNIIARIEPWLEAALPTPEALSHSIAKRIEAMPTEKVESFSIVAIGDGAEQAKQRPKDADEQRKDYSEKKTPYP